MACRPIAAPPGAPAQEPTLLQQAEPPAAPPVILSAHFARADDPELDGKDGVLVVFDTELDAASLHARAFLVSRATQGPTRAEQAILAPASEDDENRSVLLVGELGEATAGGEPTHVAIAGPVFAEDGRPLQGLGATILPFAAASTVVATQLLSPAPGRCEGSAQVLRTYWTDELRGVEAEDLSRVRVRLHGGAVHEPSRFDDHSSEHAEAGQDNVLDLCVDDPAPIHGLTVEPGAFRDPAGHPSGAVELRVADVSADR